MEKRDLDLIHFRIKLSAYDSKLLVDASHAIMALTNHLDPIIVSGPIPLPKKTRYWCLLKSPHVDKKSREHFSATRYSRVIDVKTKSSLIDEFSSLLRSIMFPAGISMQLKNY